MSTTGGLEGVWWLLIITAKNEIVTPAGRRASFKWPIRAKLNLHLTYNFAVNKAWSIPPESHFGCRSATNYERLLCRGKRLQQQIGEP